MSALKFTANKGNSIQFVPFLPTFLVFKKYMEAYEITLLSVCVCAYVCVPVYPALFFFRFLCDPCRINEK
jgi:hypothetical protein